MSRLAYIIYAIVVVIVSTSINRSFVPGNGGGASGWGSGGGYRGGGLSGGGIGSTGGHK